MNADGKDIAQLAITPLDIQTIMMIANFGCQSKISKKVVHLFVKI